MTIQPRVARWARRFPFKARPLHALLLLALAGWQVGLRASATQRAAETPARIEFDSAFVYGGKGIDISRFAYGNATDPGLYVPDVYVNGNWLGRTEVRFAAPQADMGAHPCFDQALLERAGIDMAQLPKDETGGDEKTGGASGINGAVGTQDSDAACPRLEQRVAGATARFDPGTQRLDLSIPQVLMRRVARGYVDPAQWTAGVPAALLGYNFNTYHARNGSRGSSTQSYLGLNGGFNYERWHLRHNGSLSLSDGGRRRYQGIATYVQRDIADWSSQLILGDSYTDGELMDSVSFRGVRLRTDDRMLPESQRGFAPVVRGVAQTNARVTVHQNGNKLYETTVAPGAFVIDDLFPMGYGGDLRVDVTEADGSVRSFSVPYAAVPRSLREGRHRYSLTAGTVRHLPDSAPFFAQGGWQYGLSNMVTAYGGATVAKGYVSPTVGAVLNTTWGAFGMDLTHASTRIPNDRSYSGQSLRGTYAKSFQETGTHVALATYRYSTNGFFGLNDAMRTRDLALAGRPSGSLQRLRSQTSLTLGQNMGPGAGNLGLSASLANYWGRKGNHVNFSASYSNSWGRVPYNLSVSRQRDAWGRSSTQFYAGVTIPLGDGLPSVSTRYMRNSNGTSQLQASTSGLVGRDFSYGLNTEYSSSAPGYGQGSGLYGSANGTYRGPLAQLSGSLGAGRGSRQLSVSARGAVVAHPGGVTLSQPVGETFAIVRAEHAEGASLTHTPGARIDARGYAVVPYMTPYAMNEVSLDPKGISMDVELQETSRHVAPVAGAAAMVVFKTAYSRSAVIRSQQEDGTPLPFGATISDASGKDLGVVGQAGKLLLRGLQDQGELQAQWKTKAGPASCGMSYALPERQGGTGYQAPPSLELSCVAKAGGSATPPQVAGLADHARPQKPASEHSLQGLRLSTRLGSLPPEAVTTTQADSVPQFGADPQRKAAMPPQSPTQKLKFDRTLAQLAPQPPHAIAASNT
ncbi:Heat shock protein E [Delftia tsuruhatensis]|uniref:fimbria/pilus outer membrane usher protein n=1 Tax=Delftia tsuruhatensis TaxID=180282 RepID=UPI001E76EA74|nr:fimbria/pilus outer membrane usher protein [Delftia tsuruhatensis]CAB5715434.1 Heat shock protein E [Delftia tsuruhatensis]CAC9676724.1 Heat shock protein E [Delftia tsuruhatensis]